MTSRLLLRRFPYARHAAVATAAPQTSSLPLRGGNPRELRVVVARGAASARGVAKARKLGASAMTSMAVDFWSNCTSWCCDILRQLCDDAKTKGSKGFR